MTPSDLHVLARVLDALLPHRTVGQLADDPQEAHARAAAAGRRAATSGSATDARPAGAGLGWAGGIFPARQELTEAARQVLSRLVSLRATRRARP